MTDQEDMKKKADKIRRKFIGPQSRTPVNISGVVADEILSRLDENEITTEMFDTAEKQVYNLLKVDPFPRFCAYRINKH